MNRIWSQCVKELTQFRRDRLTVALAFVLPLLSLFVFGYGTRLEQKNIRIAIQNFDNSALSREFIARLLNNDQLLIASWSGLDIVHGAIDTNKADAAVIIPPEFSRRLIGSKDAEVQVLINATDVNNARVISNSVIATTLFFLQYQGLVPQLALVKPEIRLWFNPGRKESLYVVPGSFAVILWIYPSLLASLAMVREKEQGTILQLYASSISARELIAGKALAYFFVGCAEAVFIILISMVLFNIGLVGDPTPFFVGSIFFLMNAVVFGLLIGANTTTQSAAVQGVATVGFTSALLLSGFLYPLRNIVYPLSLFSNLVPARWYIQLARNAFVRGGSWTSDWYIPLLFILFTVFLFRVACKRMQQMQLKD